jgi:hypothetical protein
MSDRLALGLGLAFAASVALNWGFFAQHRATRRMPSLSVRRPKRSLQLLFTDPAWLSGYVVGLIGWALYVVALAFAPLSLVQATAAGGVGVLALLVRWTEGATLHRRDWAGVAAALIGLALLGLSLTGSTGSGVGADWTRVASLIVVSCMIAWASWSWGSRLLAAGAGAGIAAGLMYAAGDVGTRAAIGTGGRFAFVPVLLLCHLLGFVALQSGFQKGSVLATAGVASVLTNALPIAAGIVVFGEPLGSGIVGLLRGSAFVCVVVGAALLARAAPGARDADEPRRSALAGPGIEPFLQGSPGSLELPGSTRSGA